MIRLEARPEPSRTFQWASPLIAVVATVAIGFLLFPLMAPLVLPACVWGMLAFYPRVS